MGEKDILEKKYLQNNERFADAFNYFIYEGKQIINPGSLKDVDSVEIAVPYGNNAREPIQRIRDLSKTWEIIRAASDSRAIYVILGAEVQDQVHYAGPVKDMVYDSLNYVRQVSETKNSYKKTLPAAAKNGSKINMSKSEFLSGFRKSDHLMPVVTGAGEIIGFSELVF